MYEIKNYEWNGFGFPIIFAKLPAMKVKGELIPNVKWIKLANPLVKFICASQDLPFSGDQIKFIRHHLNMTLSEFATFVGVLEQSVIRWEKCKKSSAQIDENTEFIFRIKVLKKLKSGKHNINQIIQKIDENSTSKKISKYKKLKPLRFTKARINNFK